MSQKAELLWYLHSKPFYFKNQDVKYEYDKLQLISLTNIVS